MRLIGTGEDAGRHRGSLQAGTDAGSAYTSGPRVTGFVSAQHEDSSGKLWRRMRSKELGEAGDQERKLEKARIHGRMDGLARRWAPLGGAQPLPALHLEVGGKTGAPFRAWS